MSEFDPSKSKKSSQMSSIVLSNLYLLCSFILYIPFFSPYLFKILSVLSPLFISTFLLLALLVASPKLLHEYHKAVDKLGADDDEFQDLEFEELQVYKTVFEASAFETRQDPDQVLEVRAEETSTCGQVSEEEPVDKCAIQGGIKQGLLVENDGAEVKPESIESGDQQSRTKRRGFDSRPARKDKEWKRTLACKLYEERHNRGGEGMDMLWEAQAHETEKGSAPSPTYGDDKVHFCCLQALKFSAAKKMNMGMGRPNLARFSKALRGIGWLHHATKKPYR